MVGRLIKYRGIEQISKYIQGNGSQASLCRRKELQIWEGGRLEQARWSQIIIGGVSVNSWHLISLYFYLYISRTRCVYMCLYVCVCM